jgi:protease II
MLNPKTIAYEWQMRTRRREAKMTKLDTDLEYEDEDQMGSPHEVQWRQNSLGPGHTVLLHLHASNSDEGFNSVAKTSGCRLWNWLDSTIIHAVQHCQKHDQTSGHRILTFLP